jgi:hypothetical protein
MDQPSRAEEDLRVIRSLMERATIYRAISAPTALVAGSLSILTAAAAYYNNEVDLIFGRVIRGRQFAKIWIAVLIIALAANTFFVWREARRNGRPFISSGMRLALRAIAPCLLIPAAFTAWFYSTGYLGGAELDLVVVWIVSYGLALLSTALFAPRSLGVLGWAFLLSGLAVPALTNLIDYFSVEVPLVAMGTTFGLYHLIYAVCTWPRKTSARYEQLGDE